jgi:hypothetical protein
MVVRRFHRAEQPQGLVAESLDQQETCERFGTVDRVVAGQGASPMTETGGLSGGVPVRQFSSPGGQSIGCRTVPRGITVGCKQCGQDVGQGMVVDRSDSPCLTGTAPPQRRQTMPSQSVTPQHSRCRQLCGIRRCPTRADDE